MHFRIQTQHKIKKKEYNKAMSEVRISVELLFGDIKIYFTKMLKIGVSAVGKQFLVCGKCVTCFNGNVISEYFDMQPPSLEEHFQ